MSDPKNARRSIAQSALPRCEHAHNVCASHYRGSIVPGSRWPNGSFRYDLLSLSYTILCPLPPVGGRYWKVEYRLDVSLHGLRCK